MMEKQKISNILAKLAWALKDYRDFCKRDSLKKIEDISAVLQKAAELKKKDS